MEAAFVSTTLPAEGPEAGEVESAATGAGEGIDTLIRLFNPRPNRDLAGVEDDAEEEEADDDGGLGGIAKYPLFHVEHTLGSGLRTRQDCSENCRRE